MNEEDKRVYDFYNKDDRWNIVDAKNLTDMETYKDLDSDEFMMNLHFTFEYNGKKYKLETIVTDFKELEDE